jgi:hypothetical protein
MIMVNVESRVFHGISRTGPGKPPSNGLIKATYNNIVRAISAYNHRGHPLLITVETEDGPFEMFVDDRWTFAELWNRITTLLPLPSSARREALYTPHEWTYQHTLHEVSSCNPRKDAVG